MKFSVARTLLAEKGYALVPRDEAYCNRQVCQIYAVAGTQEYRIVALSVLAAIGVKQFQAWIAELPPVGSDEVVL